MSAITHLLPSPCTNILEQEWFLYYLVFYLSVKDALSSSLVAKCFPRLKQVKFDNPFSLGTRITSVHVLLVGTVYSWRPHLMELIECRSGDRDREN